MWKTRRQLREEAIDHAVLQATGGRICDETGLYVLRVTDDELQWSYNRLQARGLIKRHAPSPSDFRRC